MNKEEQIRKINFMLEHTENSKTLEYMYFLVYSIFVSDVREGASV